MDKNNWLDKSVIDPGESRGGGVFPHEAQLLEYCDVTLHPSLPDMSEAVEIIKKTKILSKIPVNLSVK
jgi:hypothetical protein